MPIARTYAGKKVGDLHDWVGRRHVRTMRFLNFLPGILLFLSLSLVHLFSVNICLASENSPSPDKDIESLMNKVFLAYGGRETFTRATSNSIATGEQKPLGNAVQSKASQFRAVRKSGGLRIDLATEGVWSSTVFDGSRAWKMEGKNVRDLGAEETSVLAQERDRELSVLARYGDPSYSFKLRGSTLYKALPVYAVEVSRSGNKPTTVFIDQKNYLVSALSYPAVDLDSKNPATISVDFEEYRPTGGTLFPFKQLQSVNDTPVLETDFQSVDFGAVSDEEPFSRPSMGNELRFDKVITVPMTFSHKEIVVKVSINGGEPQDFLFDTGASDTVIDRRLAAENLLDRKSPVQLNTAAGVVLGQAAEIKKLQVGDLSIPDVRAIVMDLSSQGRQLGRPISGILGCNVLSRCVFTIDYGKSQLIFRDFACFKAPPGATVVPFVEKKAPMVKVLLNGKDELSCIVDTGAAFNNLPWVTGKKYQSGQAVHYTEGVGAEGRSVKLGTVQIPVVKLGTATVRDVSFTYSVDADPAKKGLVTGASTGILGNPFWQNFCLSLDYRTHQLVVQPNPALLSRSQLEQMVGSGDSKLIVYRDFRAAEQAYQQALNKVMVLGDPKQQARIWGRLGNLRRVMAKDLGRPEQSRVAYEYFSKAQELAHKLDDREIEGRILADWALLFMDSNQMQEADRSLQGAALLAPQDPQVMVDYAVYLNKNHRYGDMRYYIDKALFLEPSNWQALWYRLKLSETFADMQAQKDTLKEILKYYPWSKVAQEKSAALNSPALSVP